MWLNVYKNYKKLDAYQIVAEKAAVRVAEYKYHEHRGRVNKNKVPAVIAEAGLLRDLDQWDRHIWDSTDPDDSGSDKTTDIGPVLSRKMEYDANGQQVIKHYIDDYIQHKINDMLDRFKQKSRELLLTWIVQLHNLGATDVGIDPRQ